MSTVHQIGDELFQLFQKMIPSPDKQGGKRAARMSETQITQNLDRFYKEAAMLREKHRLGLIARARAIRRFQQRMIESGYAADLVKRVIFAMILSSFTGRK